MTELTGPIIERYIAKTPGSAARFARSDKVIPSGVTHDLRYLEPHPLYVERALGPRKWDVDGNEYVDYFGGHGALLLGHNHPAVVEAVQAQLARGTHHGASHELELRWAEQICRMLPSAEKVRFTASGTEATQLAIRIVRAYTGRPRIVRFLGHFHGWHDQVAFGANSHFDGSVPAGILPQVVEGAVLCPAGDPKLLERTLRERDDIAGVIIEPTGASFGQVPLLEGFLAEVRRLTAEARVPLIFDEVITGFRVSPGGAQQYYGIVPDVTTLAKIVAGGLPGGAVAGRAEIMDVLTMRSDSAWNTTGRVPHQGTFNANPLSAAAGLAALELIAVTDVVTRANRAAQQLREEMNLAVQRAGLPWIVYGEFSGFHVFLNPEEREISLSDLRGGRLALNELKGSVPASVRSELRCAMLVEGVDIMPWPGGCVSCVHGAREIDQTVSAFKELMRSFKLSHNKRKVSPSSTPACTTAPR